MFVSFIVQLIILHTFQVIYNHFIAQLRDFLNFIFHFFTGCFLISKLEPQAAIQVANGFEATTIFLSFLIFLQGGMAITPDYPQHYLQR